MALSSVTALSQLMGLVLTPLITRLYSPEVFGFTNTLGSLSMLFAVFSTMGYHDAILLPRYRKNALRVVLLCIALTFICSFISMFLVFLFSRHIASLVNLPNIESYLFLIPFGVIIHGLYQTMRMFNSRLLNFNTIATTRISENLISKILQIILANLYKAQAICIIFSEYTSSIIKNVILFKKSGLLKQANKSHFKLGEIIVIIRKYRKFPMFNVWSELLGRLPAVMIALLITKYFGQNVLGNYSLAVMVLVLPSNLFISAISEAIKPRVAKARFGNENNNMVQIITEKIFIILIFPYMTIGIFGHELFPIIFGERWFLAGIIASVLSIRSFTEAIFSQLFLLIDILQKQELHLLKNAIKLTIIAISIFVGKQNTNVVLLFLMIAVLESIFLVLIGGYLINTINFPILKMLQRIYKFLFINIFIGILLYLFHFTFNVHTFTLLPISFIMYYSIVIYFDREISQLLSTKFFKD